MPTPAGQPGPLLAGRMWQDAECDMTSESPYHAKLMSRVRPQVRNQIENMLDCTLIADNNDSIKVHSALLSEFWPNLDDLIAGNPDSCRCQREELVLVFPQIKIASIISFVNLIYRGFCDIKDVAEEQEVKDLLGLMGVEWNLALLFSNLDPFENLDDGVGAMHTVSGDDGSDVWDDPMGSGTGWDDPVTIGSVSEIDKTALSCSSFVRSKEMFTMSYEVGNYGVKHTVQAEDGDNLLEDDDGCSSENYTSIGECFEGEDDEVSVALVQNVLEPCIFDENWMDSQITFAFEQAENDKLCSKFCSYECHKILKDWAPETVKQMGTLFRSEKGITETKSNLLRHLQSQSNIGVVTDSYRVHCQSFCLKFFASLTNISEFIVKSVIVEFWKGRSLYKHGNEGSLKHLTVATTNFICWLKQFSEAYGQYAPDTNTTVLSYWLNKQYLFNLYLDETTAPHLSIAAFYQNFKIHFGFNRSDKILPHVIISKYSSHSICTQCVALNNNRRQARTETELRQATDLRNQHKMVFGEARRTIQEIKQSAISFPEDNLFLQERFLIICLKSSGYNSLLNQVEI